MSDRGGSAGWGGGEGSGNAKTQDPFLEPPSSPKLPEEFSTNEILRAMGHELKAIRFTTTLLVIVALIQAAFLVAWLLGLIQIEFKPLSHSGF